MDDNTKRSKTSVKKSGKKLFLLCSNSFLIKNLSQCTVIKERSKKVDSYLPPGSVFGGAACFVDFRSDFSHLYF